MFQSSISSTVLDKGISPVKSLSSELVKTVCLRSINCAVSDSGSELCKLVTNLVCMSKFCKLGCFRIQSNLLMWSPVLRDHLP